MSQTRRCPVCGTDIPANAQFCTNCGARLDAGADDTAPHQPIGPAQPSSPNRSRTAVIALSAVAATLAVVAVVLGVINFVPRQTTGASDATADTQAQSGSSTANAAASGSDDGGQAGGTSGQGGSSSTNVIVYTGDAGSGGSSTTTTVTGGEPSETSVLATLRSQKGTLSSLDSDIRAVADDFNRYAKDGSWSQQEAAASTASQVQSRVSSASASFDGVYVPASSAYRSTYQSMQTCYDDLQRRIDCMVSSWQLRLNGTSDYLAPIREQNDASGTNRYKTDFDNRMASLGV